MFGSAYVLLFSLCAAPVELPLAPTCVHPVARVIVASAHHAAAVASTSDCREIMSLLRRWERNVARLPEPSRAQHDRLRHEVASVINWHAAIASRILVGQIDVPRLKRTFDWAIIERSNGRVSLEATPRDETERLFYRSLRIWLEDQTGSPAELAVCDRHGAVRLACQFNSSTSASP